MESELIRLADTCRLTPAVAQQVMAGATLPVVAARILSANEVCEQFGSMSTLSESERPAGAIWLPVPSQATGTFPESEPQEREGSLALRYLGDGLPVVVLTLTSESVTLVIAVLLWDAKAKRWLQDSIERRAFRLVVEPADGGQSSFVNGVFQLPHNAVSGLLDFDFSVDESDRGHALRAAALTALATQNRHGESGKDRCSGSRQTLVGVVTGGISDLGEIAALLPLTS